MDSFEQGNECGAGPRNERLERAERHPEQRRRLAVGIAFAKDDERRGAFALTEGGERAVECNSLLEAGVAGAITDVLERCEERNGAGGAAAVKESASRDRPKPSREAALAAPLAERSPRREQCVLGYVVSLVARQSACEAAKLRFVLAHQCGEGGKVALRRPSD